MNKKYNSSQVYIFQIAMRHPASCVCKFCAAWVKESKDHPNDCECPACVEDEKFADDEWEDRFYG